jgi:hypothetical protein
MPETVSHTCSKFLKVWQLVECSIVTMASCCEVKVIDGVQKSNQWKTTNFYFRHLPSINFLITKILLRKTETTALAALNEPKTNHYAKN